MPAVDKVDLKSARKLFMVSRVKSQIAQMHDTKDEDVDAELERIHTSLSKTFGSDLAKTIIEEAIVAADQQISMAIQSVIADSVKDQIG